MMMSPSQVVNLVAIIISVAGLSADRAFQPSILDIG
jgi:hypothetical protein